MKNLHSYGCQHIKSVPLNFVEFLRIPIQIFSNSLQNAVTTCRASKKHNKKEKGTDAEKSKEDCLVTICSEM